jgi:hypothetical protein
MYDYILYIRIVHVLRNIDLFGQACLHAPMEYMCICVPASSYIYLYVYRPIYYAAVVVAAHIYVDTGFRVKHTSALHLETKHMEICNDFHASAAFPLGKESSRVSSA